MNRNNKFVNEIEIIFTKIWLIQWCSFVYVFWKREHFYFNHIYKYMNVFIYAEK